LCLIYKDGRHYLRNSPKNCARLGEAGAKKLKDCDKLAGARYEYLRDKGSDRNLSESAGTGALLGLNTIENIRLAAQ